MSQAPESGLVQSVQARLKSIATRTGRPFVEMLELYAVERFLHRLGRSPQREHFVLKGALLLRQWLGTDARPTRDIDLLGPGDLDANGLKVAITDIVRTEVEDDAIVVIVESIAIRPVRVGSVVLGLRAKFDASMGRTRLRYQVDVGLGDAVFPREVEIVPGGLLGMPMAGVSRQRRATRAGRRFRQSGSDHSAIRHTGSQFGSRCASVQRPLGAGRAMAVSE